MIDISNWTIKTRRAMKVIGSLASCENRDKEEAIMAHISQDSFMDLIDDIAKDNGASFDDLTIEQVGSIVGMISKKHVSNT